jgi:hypothetical protein
MRGDRGLGALWSVALALYLAQSFVFCIVYILGIDDDSFVFGDL